MLENPDRNTLFDCTRVIFKFMAQRYVLFSLEMRFFLDLVLSSSELFVCV